MSVKVENSQIAPMGSVRIARAAANPSRLSTADHDLARDMHRASSAMGKSAHLVDDAVMVARVSRECAELIDYQRGILARWQVAGPGDLVAIDALLRTDRWRTLYRGVYLAYTGSASREGILWAAARRCGPEAALSHQTAAELDGITDRRESAIHVTIPTVQRVLIASHELAGGVPPIVVHRSARLSLARHPARTPPRTRSEETVLDLAVSARSVDDVFFWISAACSRRIVTPAQIREAAASRPKMRWRADVVVALDEVSDGVFSNLEHRYVRNVERPHGLPKPKRQARMNRNGRSAYLDNFFADYGVTVELDGRAAHPVEARWQDIHRDNYFAGAGIITLRYSWADVTNRPCAVASEIAMLLRQRGWVGTLRSCGPSCRATRP
jgi:very-short-patch-repair endonuclease